MTGSSSSDARFDKLCGGRGVLLKGQYTRFQSHSDSKSNILQATYRSVGEVGSQDDGGSSADEIARVAKGLPTAFEDAGKSGVPVRITEGDDGDYAVLNGSRELPRCEVRNLSTLAGVIIKL